MLIFPPARMGAILPWFLPARKFLSLSGGPMAMRPAVEGLAQAVQKPVPTIAGKMD